MFGRGRDDAPRDVVLVSRDRGAVKFSGFSNPTESISWLKEIDYVLTERMDYTVEEKASHDFLLIDNARMWWTTRRDTRDFTWQQFKDAFRSHFCPQSFMNRKRIEFERLRQGGETTVTEHEVKFRELAEYAPTLIARDEDKRFKFLEGIKQEYRMYLTGTPHSTYESMRDAALELERHSRVTTRSKGRQSKSTAENTEYGSSGQGSSKRGSYSSGSSGGSSNYRRDWQSPRGSRFQRGGQSHNTSHTSGGDNRKDGQTRRPCGHCGIYHTGECQIIPAVICYDVEKEDESCNYSAKGVQSTL